MGAQIFFDVGQAYYLPQYLPVYQELVSRGVVCRFVFYEDPVMRTALEKIIEKEALPANTVPSVATAVELYREAKPAWIVFGNGCSFLPQLDPASRTALLYHGIGIKDCYYNAGLMEMTVRFVEGSFRHRELRHRHPNACLCDVGFAKLDPLFGPPETVPRLDLALRGLDPRKKTVLYAPTYYPSSIEMMPDNLPELLSECNLLVKPHHFTLTLSAYRKQVKKLDVWNRYENVHVASKDDYSLLPFFGSADILVSEASSALFEFAALDRPVVWLDFYKLRWGYRGPFRFRFTRRMDKTIMQYADIAAHAPNARQAPEIILQQLAHPGEYSGTRRRYTIELVGTVDGRASERIADYLLNCS